jgi:hypothetical protein
MSILDHNLWKLKSHVMLGAVQEASRFTSFEKLGLSPRALGVKTPLEACPMAGARPGPWPGGSRALSQGTGWVQAHVTQRF